jgi:hypothetical protein
MESTQLIINIIAGFSILALAIAFFLWRSKLNQALANILIPQKDITLQNLITDYLKRIEILENRTDTLQNTVKNHAIRLDEKLGKVGFMRFNPYGDTGGDQSFCIVFLDDKNNGVMVTTLYRRGETQTFSKKIIGAKSENNLTAEEQETLNIVINKK